ncbi:MAG: DUF488 domain-containing protein [Candidatus Thiodiazotropha taylori]
MTHIFTIGYEGANIDDFIKTLRCMGVNTLLDVREIPISRKKGFSKTRLREELIRAGIYYRHEKMLGSPKPVRDKLKISGDYTLFFREFDRHLKQQDDLLEILADDLQGSVALMCYERNYQECHRSSVARALGDLVGVEPKHIGVQGSEQRKAYKMSIQNSRKSISTA